MWRSKGAKRNAGEGNRGDNRDIFFPLFGVKGGCGEKDVEVAIAGKV